jgi:hypothetical protein
MSVTGYIDAPLDQFGGLVTNMPASDLPLGVSPDCADVAFEPAPWSRVPACKMFSRPSPEIPR